MIPYEPGGVVLVRFPFTDLTSGKKRPAVLISNVEYSLKYNDLVVLALTGIDQNDRSLALRDWREAGLVKPTWIKPLIATLGRSVVDRQIGSLSVRDRKCISVALRVILPDEFTSSSC